MIIEGPDGVGKTTVCQILSRKLDLPIIKMPKTNKYFKEGNVEEFSSFFNQLMCQFEEFSFIQDRGYPSSLVYAEVYGRQDVDIEAIDRYVGIMKPIVIILTSSIDNLKLRKKDELIDKKEYPRLVDGYAKLSYGNTHRVDTNLQSPQEICQVILDILNQS